MATHSQIRSCVNLISREGLTKYSFYFFLFLFLFLLVRSKQVNKLCFTPQVLTDFLVLRYTDLSLQDVSWYSLPSCVVVSLLHPHPNLTARRKLVSPEFMGVRQQLNWFSTWSPKKTRPLPKRGTIFLLSTCAQLCPVRNTHELRAPFVGKPTKPPFMTNEDRASYPSRKGSLAYGSTRGQLPCHFGLNYGCLYDSSSL